MRFAFANAVGVDNLQAFDSILNAAIEEVLQQRQLAFFGRDDQLADAAILDAFAVAILPELAPAFDTKLRLERSGLVIDAGVDHTAVVAGLMGGEQFLFLEQDELEVRMAEQELPRGCQADDAAAHDRDVVRHITTILAPPRGARYSTSGKAARTAAGKNRGMTSTLTRTIPPFKNEVVKSFTDPADAAAMKAALASVKERFGRHYPLVIDGDRIETEKQIRSLNPSHPGVVVGLTSSASKEQANAAVAAASRRSMKFL